MMNYELFKEVLVEQILGFMPSEYQNSRVEINSVTKVNQTYDGLNIIPPDGGNTKIFPTIYVNTMYTHYKECGNLEEVLRKAAASIDNAFHQVQNNSAMLNFEEAKDNIVMQLVNREQNKDLLENLPHRDFQDLSIIYRWLVESDVNGISSAIVNISLAEKLGMNEEQLFQAAVINTQTLLPPTIRSMNEVIREMFIDDGMPEEMIDIMLGEMPADKAMYVISNQRGINGAVSMLYEDGLHELAEKLDSDLYIMPSSVNEVIAVSAKMGDPNELAQMVADINMDQVSLEERLSNQVYHYDKDLRKLSLATDTPNKRLDGIVAEVNLIYDFPSQSR